jgi:pimeloyl-[acyl-carrier protein] methyl ester esterase
MQKNIMLLHGWGMNRAVWQLVQEALSSDPALHVQALNLPGFGGASWHSESYELHEVSDRLAEQIPNNSVLVAWSMAGLLAIDIATRHRDKVAKLVFVGSSPFFVQQANWSGIKPEVLEQFMLSLMSSPAKTVERFLAIQAMGSEHAKEDIKRLKSWLSEEPAPSAVALSGGLRLLNECDLRADFSALTIPMHGIFGRLDALVPVKVVESLQELNPNFCPEILPKASHAPFISHREEFVTLLKSML